MNRRNFIQTMGTVAAAFVARPERQPEKAPILSLIHI